LHLDEVASRIRIISLAGRKLGECFHTVAGATLQRRKLKLIYHSRSTNGACRLAAADGLLSG
jgi:hypothetical protein